ncbi:MAG: sulfotransferase [Bacteroidota bacterium]
MPAQLSKRYVRTRPTKALSRLVSWALVEGRPLTTRGRWINPLVFGLQRVALALPAVRAVERPIFIIGTGRSGTTLLGTVLSMHRSVAFLNEPKALWHRIHPEEDVIGSYASGPARFYLDAEEATPARVRKAHHLFGAYLTAVRGQRLLDKYPELVFRVAFVRALFPDAQFVFLVRNGWDACRSIQDWSTRLGVESGNEVHDWWGRDDRKWHHLLDYAAEQAPDLAAAVPALRSVGDHRQRAALEWALAMQAGLDAQDRLPNQVHLVRYEDLTASPQATLAALFQTLALPDDAVCRAFAKQEVRPGRAHEPFVLMPEVARIFQTLMHRLGYGLDIQEGGNG